MNKILFHSFSLGDVEDPELYASWAVQEWQQTELGQWVIDSALTPLEFHIDHDMYNMGYRVAITGSLKEQDEVFFRLKYQ
jgi:hypothetical protein